MKDSISYHEEISSSRTTILFIALTFLFLVLSIWRVLMRGWDTLAIVLVFLCCLFFFYVLNYRKLIIQLAYNSLRLGFGIFHWTIPLANIANCQLDDDLPALKKYGGAGIHWYVNNNRYRASWNFLEYDRVVIELKDKKGLVRDISFSTRNPDELIGMINKAAAES